MPFTYIPNLRPLYPRNASREAETLYVNERADHVNTPATGKAEIWVRNDATQSLILTDEAGADRPVVTGPATSTDNRIVRWNTTTGGLVQDSKIAIGDNGAVIWEALSSDAKLELYERGAGPSLSAGYGKVWVRNDVPTSLIFTNDIGSELQLLGDPIPLGSWNFNIVSGAGTPGTGQFDANNTLLVSTTNIRYTTTGTIEGWGRNWLDELPSPGYIVLRKKGAPAEEVVFSYSAITDVAGVWADFTVVWNSDTTADTNWATDDEWTLYVHTTGGGGGFADAPDAALFTERADHVNAPAATKGEIWVRNDAPNTPMFTDDDGNDIDLAWFVRNALKNNADQAMGKAQRSAFFPVQGGSYDQAADSDLFMGYDRYANRHYMTFFDSSASDIGLAWAKDGSGPTDWTTIDVITSGAVIGQHGGFASDGTNLCVGINDGCYKSTTLEPTNVTGGDFTKYAFGTITACTGIVWDDDNSLFIACGTDAGTGYVETSPDGQTWTLRLNAGARLPRSLDIDWVQGHSMVVFGSTSTDIYYSLNGTTWTLDNTSVPTTGLNQVRFSNHLRTWIGIDAAGTPLLWTKERQGSVNAVWVATNLTCYGLVAGDDMCAYTDDQRTVQQIWWAFNGQSATTTGHTRNYASYLGIGAGLAYHSSGFGAANTRCRISPGGGLLCFPRYDDGDIISMRYGPVPND